MADIQVIRTCFGVEARRDIMDESMHIARTRWKSYDEHASSKSTRMYIWLADYHISERSEEEEPTRLHWISRVEEFPVDGV